MAQISGRTRSRTAIRLLLLLGTLMGLALIEIGEASAAAPCPSGLVWRERFAGDYLCVPPDERYRLENGYCRAGYVWRERFNGDAVCVPPAERYRLANGYCRSGYVWRESNPSDHVWCDACSARAAKDRSAG
jgi:hypothetical protein